MDIKKRLISLLITIAIILGVILLVWLLATYDALLIVFFYLFLFFCIAIVSDAIYDELKRKR